MSNQATVFALAALAVALAGAPARLFADSTAPADITGITALTGSGPERIRLNWTSPGDDGLTGDLVAGSSFGEMGLVREFLEIPEGRG